MNQATKRVWGVLIIMMISATLIQVQAGATSADGCVPRKVTLSQNLVGEDDYEFLVYKVVLKNECACSLSELYLSCGTTFEPVLIVPSDILKRNPEEDACRVNLDIPAGGSREFEYHATNEWPGLDVVFVVCAPQ